MTRDDQTVQSTINILLVEDNPDHAAIIQRALTTSDAPVKIKVITNGLDALDYIRKFSKNPRQRSQRKPDIILLDLKLPRCDGFQVARTIKADPKLCTIPIVTLSTSARQEDRDLLLACGVEGFITKPNNYEEFKGIAATIRSLLNKDC
jgi:CheY-like chemotaxis protein